MRLRHQKRDRDKVLTHLEKYGDRRRFSEIDDLDVYTVSEGIIKLISDSGNIKPLLQIYNLNNNNLYWSSRSLRRPLGLCSCSIYSSTGSVCNTEHTNGWMPIGPIIASEIQSVIISDIDKLPLAIYLKTNIHYIDTINNINDIQQQQNFSCPTPSEPRTDTFYHLMKEGIHVGKSLPGNSESEHYTNTYIQKLEFMVKDYSKSIADGYKTKYFWYGETSNNYISQQQIMEEYFPEDIDE